MKIALVAIAIIAIAIACDAAPGNMASRLDYCHGEQADDHICNASGAKAGRGTIPVEQEFGLLQAHTIPTSEYTPMPTPESVLNFNSSPTPNPIHSEEWYPTAVALCPEETKVIGLITVEERSRSSMGPYFETAEEWSRKYPHGIAQCQGGGVRWIGEGDNSIQAPYFNPVFRPIPPSEYLPDDYVPLRDRTATPIPASR